MVKKICHDSYPSLASSVVDADRTSHLVLISLGRHIRQEIKHICSDTHNSILRDSHVGIKRYSWVTVWAELNKEVPTLMKILALTIRDPDDNKPLLCLIASMILKHYAPRVSLVQWAISVVLYSCATPKEVSTCTYSSTGYNFTLYIDI